MGPIQYGVYTSFHHPRIKVVEMCQPEYASGPLGTDDTKFVAVMMPCAVAVYEKSDGGT
ncbi:MAG: hypothetical protein C5S47_05715 [Candidatus Methanogasteraceae archaeon]|nr:MAG: hypothetical protein C5S47_05715 [ANME-2 cluster archaeon]